MSALCITAKSKVLHPIVVSRGHPDCQEASANCLLQTLKGCEVNGQTRESNQQSAYICTDLKYLLMREAAHIYIYGKLGKELANANERNSVRHSKASSKLREQALYATVPLFIHQKWATKLS